MAGGGWFPGTVGEFRAHLRRLLATDPERIALVLVVTDDGPNATEDARLQSAQLLTMMSPTEAVAIAEGMVASIVMHMSEDERAVYLGVFEAAEGTWDVREITGEGT